MMKNKQIEQFLCWSDTTDTEHNTASGSNNEEVNILNFSIIDNR